MPAAAPRPARATAAAALTVSRTVRETTHGVRLYEPTQARPYYRLVYRDRLGKRFQLSAGTDFDAAAALAQEKDRELDAAAGDLTGQLTRTAVAAWLVTVRAGNAATHHGKYLRMTSKYFLPVAGDVPVWQLTRTDVDAAFALPTATSAKRHLRAAVGAFLTWAAAAEQPLVAHPREHFLPKQPRNAKSGKAKQQHGESHLFIDPKERPSPAACGALADALLAHGAGKRWGEQLWLMVAVAASCGLRLGELIGMTVDQLLFSSGELFVDKQLIRANGVPPGLTPPKWGRSRTTILPERTIWGAPLRERLEAFVAGMEPGDTVFPAPRGGWIHQSNWGKRTFKPVRDTVPLWADRWSFHSLRHAFCSYLLSSDPATGKVAAQDTDVALAAGHRDSGVTRAMYVGSTSGALGRLNAVMSGVPAAAAAPVERAKRAAQPAAPG
jgi:integrase